MAGDEKRYLIHNEQTKLTATCLNGLAIAAVAVGGIAPTVAVVMGTVTLPLGAVAVSSLVWFFLGGGLHFSARAVLRRLRE